MLNPPSALRASTRWTSLVVPLDERCRPARNDIGIEPLGGNFDEERIEPIAAKIRGPDEIAAGDVEISFRHLFVIVTIEIVAALRIEVGHDLSHDEDVQRPVGMAVRIQ